jgi:ABC-type polysaccharide/polyol phosphate export permease
LEDFFNIPEIKEQLKEFGKNRTRTYIILIIICIIILVSKTEKDSPTVLFMTPFLILGISTMLFPRKTYKTIMSFLEKKEDQLKEIAIKSNNFAFKISLILNNLAKLCCDKIEYDGGSKYAF